MKISVLPTMPNSPKPSGTITPLSEAGYLIGRRRRAGMAAVLARRPGEGFCRAESVTVVRTVEEVVDDVVWAAPWIEAEELVHIPCIVQLSTNRVGVKRHHVAQAQLLSRRERRARNCSVIVSVLARVCPHKRNHSEVKRGRESLGPGLHMSWIVELHASTITEHPRIHKSDCLLPDYYTHGWLRQLPI